MIFAAIDFETANYWPTSMCAAGLAVFTDGKLTESKHWLVRPPVGHGWFVPEFIEIHGIRHRDVFHLPHFDAIAPEFLPVLGAADFVVAHNAAFDRRVLESTLDHFGLDCPELKYICTLQAARQAWPELPRHSLDVVAAHLGFQFDHHNAQSDAQAAGLVLLATMKNSGVNTPT